MHMLSVLSDAEWGEMLAKWKTHPTVEPTVEARGARGAEGWDASYLRFLLACVVGVIAYASGMLSNEVHTMDDR